MRTLKFRYWLKGKLQGIREIGVDFMDPPWDWDTVEQFTGLTDCEGKEIYEGDIVDCERGFKATVEWHLEGYSLKVKGHGLFSLSDVGNIRIIGTIHDEGGGK